MTLTPVLGMVLLIYTQYRWCATDRTSRQACQFNRLICSQFAQLENVTQVEKLRYKAILTPVNAQFLARRYHQHQGVVIHQRAQIVIKSVIKLLSPFQKTLKIIQAENG